MIPRVPGYFLERPALALCVGGNARGLPGRNARLQPRLRFVRGRMLHVYLVVCYRFASQDHTLGSCIQ